MDDKRKIRVMRVALEAIASEAKEPAMKVYAQSALDETTKRDGKGSPTKHQRKISR